MTTDNRLLRTVTELTRLMDTHPSADDSILQPAGELIAALIAEDDWLPVEFATAESERYSQHLLYGDPLERFSLVSFVWGPGQEIPVHDHTVWGVVGILRGAEIEQHYELADAGLMPKGPPQRLERGQVAYVSPTLGDIHSIRNAYDDRASISIHLYGGNIGRISRSIYDEKTGERKSFVSGYSNLHTPNLWASAQTAS